MIYICIRCHLLLCLDIMRTTVTVNDALFSRVKNRLAKLGIGFGEFIERALLRELEQPVHHRTQVAVEIPTYGSGGLHAGLSWESISQSADEQLVLASLEKSR
jgi:hypothetical protein